MADNAANGAEHGGQAHAAGLHSSVQTPGGAHDNAFPPFDSTHYASLFIWLVLTFGALYLLMSRVALPRIADILQKRGDLVASDLAAAKQAQAQAEAAQREHEKTLADAKARALAMGQQAHQALAGETEAKRQALEADLAKKLTAADAEIAAKKTSAMANVGGVAEDAAAAIIQQLTGKAADPKKIAAALASVAKG